ncbi:MAG TPA: bifunctional [glutamate--ammonia ligase]-adenylyl-L-tyrosine phosphorylase/[glutamate--ammonia-ligase] adenylyltransferase [Steroidobacteraceae bacterium]|nr:bifunctional [glutamate--ammonia ligase]-adenylyl-L-tyrosine phosphorylase/[glutamate--ammonia-ligase] adenylyltransferase [Steroidobacteraceae bacterium]
MGELESSVERLPPALRPSAQRVLEKLREDPATLCALRAAPDDVQSSVARVFSVSDFVASACKQDDKLIPWLLEAPGLQASRAAGSAARTQAGATAEAKSEEDMMRVLRAWRRRELVRIAWRDLAGWASVEETLRDLSEVGDAAVACACTFATQAQSHIYGKPRSESGEVQSLVVLGMGKLGGGELNFSSDIDLVLLFPEGGDTDGRRSISNEEFFTRVARVLIRLLDAVTADGFVFRVDTRLRPFGDSGPLVASFGAFENYLQEHGRDWERYAYVKARELTGVREYAELFQEAVRPFVYRRYLDFGVFESLREMKELIAREVARRELRDNIKLGPGGIREIEFIVQALQLLRGGSDRRLQSQSLLTVLPLLTGQKLLSAKATSELKDAYLFLRRLENRLQMLNDEQVHTLPDDAVSRERLQIAMGARSWEALRAELDQHRAAVTHQFQLLLSTSAQPASSPTTSHELDALLEGTVTREALQASVERLGLSDAAAVATQLDEWRNASTVQRLGETSRRRLQVLMPRLLAVLKNVPDPSTTLRRTLRILEAVGSRSAYVALLNENAAALRRLVEICARSEFLGQQIVAFPLLLDELVDERVLEELPSREQFAAEIRARLEHVPEADPERQVEALRQFQRAAMFRVALADLTQRLPLMQVSDRLTDIAELIIGEAMTLAWQQVTEQHGIPMCGTASELRPASVAAVGYGKLGALELGYASDLDLVFLHDSAGEVQRTNGARALENGVFFLRLGQRIIHLLTLHSAAGRLYEVDMRLRPSGKGGLMVTQIEAFRDYQKSEAWTWEHQALLRARAVAGDAALRRRFEDIRVDVLCHEVKRESLRDEVRKMRGRMRAELSRARAGQFDVKQDPGGIADIEFLAQYWALNWSDRYPPLVMFSDTIRQLESVASANLVPQATVDVLTRTYRTYRAALHHRSLEDLAAVVDESEFAVERREVIAIWNATMLEA